MANQEQTQDKTGKDNTGGRGFAGMDPDQQKKVASEGGKASQHSETDESESENERATGDKSASKKSETNQ